MLPVTDPETGTTVASIRGRTFQVQPRIVRVLEGGADATITQTFHAAGLPVAYFDGSVRTVSPRVQESTFWGQITPDGGEVVGSE